MVTKMSRLWTLAAMTVAVAGLSSCLKNSDPEPQKPVTYVAFINSLATTYDAEVVMDGKTITTQPFKYTTGLGSLFNPGNYEYKFEKHGTDSLLASVSARFDTSRYNTLILYGSDSAGAGIHRIREEWANPSTDKANIRFFNLLPSTKSVDIYIGGVKVFGSRVYKDFVTGQYDTWTAQNLGTHVISAKLADGTEIAVKQDGSLNARGGFYNIFLTGVENVTTGTLKPQIVVMGYQSQNY